MKNTVIKLVVILAVVIGCILLFYNKNSDSGKYKIGIMQPVEHEALDQARLGFIDGLKEAGYIDGENIEIDYKNANGDQANNNTIADTFASQKELILAIATPSAEAAANKIKDIPILFTAVTDPVSVGLVKSVDNVGGNISGTSDRVYVSEQIDILLDTKPTIKTIGLLYSSAENNSVLLINEAKEYLKSKNIAYKDMSVQNANDVLQVLQNAVGDINAIYIPTDNTIATAMPTVARVALENNLPVVPGAAEMAKDGCIGTIGVSYYDLGKQTAKMAVSILKKEKKVSELPVEYPANKVVKINEDVINKIGLILPEKYKEKN